MEKFINFTNQPVFPMRETYSGEKNAEGIPHGTGKMKYRNSLGKVLFEYEGSFRRGLRHGNGIERYENGYFRKIQCQFDCLARSLQTKIPFHDRIYEGLFTLQGKFNFNTKITYSNKDPKESYYGQLNQNLQPNGNGTLIYRNGDFFKGHFSNGHPHDKGSGKVTLADGSVYEGDMHANFQPDGRGTLTYPNGDFFKGHFSNGRPYGKGSGKTTLTDGSVYKGDMHANFQPDGRGTLTYSNGDSVKGRFLNSHPSGISIGKITLPDGTIYEGQPVESTVRMTRPIQEKSQTLDTSLSNQGPANESSSEDASRKRKRASEDLQQFPRFDRAPLSITHINKQNRSPSPENAIHGGRVIDPLFEEAEDLRQDLSQSQFNRTARLIDHFAKQNRAFSSKDEEWVENVFSDSVSSSNPSDTAAKSPNEDFLIPKTPSSDFFDPFSLLSNYEN